MCGVFLLAEVKRAAKLLQADDLSTLGGSLACLSFGSVEIACRVSDGRILGMALNQVVLPGYAAYHIGITGDAGEIPASTDVLDGTAALLDDTTMVESEEESEAQPSPKSIKAAQLVNEGLDFD